MTVNSIQLQHNQENMEKVPYEHRAVPIHFCFDYMDEIPGGVWGYHWHDELEFALVMNGQLEYHVYDPYMENNQPVLLDSGDGVFVNSKGLHMMRATEPGTVVFCLVFPAYFLDIHPASLIYKKNVQPVLDLSLTHHYLRGSDPSDAEILDTLRELFRSDPQSPIFELKCVEYVCHIWRGLIISIGSLQSISPVNSRGMIRDQRIRTMLDYIYHHFAEKITIDDIANSASVSRSECFRCFKDIVQRPPIEFLSEYRLFKATELLANTDMSVLNIADECGFRSSSYFSKVFSQHYKLTPGEYRRSHAAKQPKRYNTF